VNMCLSTYLVPLDGFGILKGVMVKSISNINFRNFFNIMLKLLFWWRYLDYL
jgi:hypothetical protein